MEEQLIKKLFTISSILSLTALVVMGIYLYGRDHSDFLRSLITQEAKAQSTQEDQTEKDYLVIPQPAGTTESDVTIENDYMNKTLIISSQKANAAFYHGKNLDGNSKHIQAVYYDTQEQVTKIYLVLDELCEYHISYHLDELRLSLTPVHEMYDKVMVVDAGHGGTSTGSVSYGISEKDVALGVVDKLKRMLDQTDIKVYYTRIGDLDVEEQQRTGIVKEAQADLYLSIHTNADAKSHVTTGIMTYYDHMNADNGLTGEILAECLQQSVVKMTGGNDQGIIEDTGNIELLYSLGIPSAMMEVGYLTNKQEAMQLASDAYQEKIARGLYDGIVKTYQSIGKSVSKVKENESSN